MNVYDDLSKGMILTSRVRDAVILIKKSYDGWRVQNCEYDGNDTFCRMVNRMRYRGKVDVEFVTGTKITVEHVVNVDNIDTANKICAIEFQGSYKNNDRVKEYHIIPCVEDTMERPSEEFVRDRLLIINDLNNSETARRQAEEQIYKAFREYQPSWDDDGLSDVLSYCEEGVIEEYGKPDEFAKNLVDELDHLWCCHYRPHLYSLEEQYKEAIA